MVTGALRRTSVRRPFLLPGACTPRPVTGQADRGDTADVSLSDGKAMPEKRLKGDHQNASG